MSSRRSVRERVRWWLWRHLCDLAWVCPANAHGRVIWKQRHDDGLLAGLRIDAMCRRDCAANGRCWCGKLESRVRERDH